MALPALDIVGHHVREAAKLAPHRPAIWLGLRAAAATGVPLVAAHWLEPAAADWAPLAGFLVALSDKGGAYRSRAEIMTAVALGGLVAVVVGSLIAGEGLATGVAVAIGLTVCSLGEAFGPRAVSVGNAIAVQLLVAASLPCSLHDVWQRALGFAGGASFALVLGLIVWPVRVYKPGRRAVAAVLHELAELARALPEGTHAVPQYRSVREHIEHARRVLAATRRGRRCETGLGERLLAALQLCDQMFGVLIGLDEALDAGCPPRARTIVVRGLAELAALFDQDAARVLLERPPPPIPSTWSGMVPDEGSQTERTLARHAFAMLARVHRERELAAYQFEWIGDESHPSISPAPDPEPGPSVRDAMREAFDVEGPIARHAIRVAIVVSIAMAVSRALDLAHPHWVTLTAYILMRPLTGATRIRAIQRVVGTVLGCVLAAAVMGETDDPHAAIVLIVVLSGLGALVERINYALYAMMITPAFALLAEMHTAHPDDVAVRIANTLIAAGIVVVGSWLWPPRLVMDFDEAIADTYKAAADYLEAVFEAILFATPDPSTEVVATRRIYGLAANRAEHALDALASERAPPGVMEPRMTQLAFMRKLAAAITTLGSTRGIAGYAAHEVELAAFAASITGSLHALSAHARSGTPLGSHPHIERLTADPELAARAERIDLALTNLIGAALRAAPEQPPALRYARSHAGAPS